MATKRSEKSGPVRKTAPRASAPGQGEFQTLRMTRKNWILFGSGILCILIGFGVLTTGDITVAPILLVIGYLVLIPWSLVALSRDRDTREDTGR